MSILIGENIKRLRTTGSVTQEQLAEALNVSSVAVSKWERGETMPDILLLPKLAHYFQITIDELMSYDACAVELEIQEFLKAHKLASEAYDIKSRRSLSADAYRRYPNDYRVMELYMWDLAGDYADNDNAVITKHRDEIDRICDRILDGCTDSFIRRDAYVMKGKLLHAAGRTEEAIALYRSNLPDWYQTVGQKSEQLFAKGTPEFAALLSENITELSRFVLNKYSKELWFCRPDLDTAGKADTAVSFCEALSALATFTTPERMHELIAYFAGDFESKLRHLTGDATPEQLARIHAYAVQGT